MQKLKLFLLILVPTVLAISCSNSNAGDAAKSGSADASAGASTGSDMYYEYTIKSNGETRSSTSTMKLYVSDGGGIRMEMFVPDPTGKRPATAPMMVLI